ncbi:platelet basic protein isoform X2 [Danio rerio]|uniref:Platelet basic protein isoform X2 n=1 Tax=Danio rerio TaxID=7955 RepID=A0AC58JLB8_DANRE
MWIRPRKHFLKYTIYWSNMRRTIFLLSLVFLICLASTEGQRMIFRKRCLCTRTYEHLRPGNIKGWKVHNPSALCDVTEIVVVLKKPQVSVCVNPESKLGQRLKKQ